MDPLLNLLPFGRNPEPVKDAGQVQPPSDQRPRGQSGRVNFGGFIQFDETNAKLVGAFGLKQFDEIYFEDPDIRRNVAALWTPILAANWTIEPYGGDEASDKDRKAAELAHFALFQHMSPNWHGHLATCGPVLLRSGFAPFEQIWQTVKWKGQTVQVPGSSTCGSLGLFGGGSRTTTATSSRWNSSCRTPATSTSPPRS